MEKLIGNVFLAVFLQDIQRVVIWDRKRDQVVVLEGDEVEALGEGLKTLEVL
jgi:hypothetical protein